MSEIAAVVAGAACAFSLAMIVGAYNFVSWRRERDESKRNEESLSREEDVRVLKVMSDDEVKRLEDEVAKVQIVIETERRKSRELFDVVERVLKERDQWKEMWFAHGREHLSAQHMLESALASTRSMLAAALVSVNKYRAKDGLDPLPFGIDPKDPPVGTAEKFQALLERAEREAPSHIDGISLRDKVVQGGETQ